MTTTLAKKFFGLLSICSNFAMKAIIQLLMLAVVAAEPTTAVAASNHRSLASQGCNDCCFKNDCRLAFSQTSPGICCGAHRIRGQTGCCPCAPRLPAPERRPHKNLNARPCSPAVVHSRSAGWVPHVSPAPTSGSAPALPTSRAPPGAASAVTTCRPSAATRAATTATTTPTTSCPPSSSS